MSEQWAIYVRINPGQQDHDLSLEAQELRCRRAAQQLGFQCEPRHIWKDVKGSASPDEPALTLVWKAVEYGEVEAIFVTLGVQPDRNTESSEFGAVSVFSSRPKDRNPLDTVTAFRRMQDAGIHIHFVESLWGFPAEQNVAVRLRVFMHPGAGEPAEPEESRPARKGNVNRIPPFGYKLDPVTKNWIVDEREARGVRLMFGMAGEGKSPKEIAGALNSAGFRTKTGVPWIKNYVTLNLRKQVHAGVQLQGWVPVEGAVPRIIPQELFDRVQKIVDDRRNADRYRDTSFLLSGFVECGHCGGLLQQSPRRSGTRFYRCWGRGPACNTPAISADLLERQVWNCLRDAILNPAERMKTVRFISVGYGRDVGTATGEPGVQKERQGTNPDWQKAMVDHCQRLARDIDDLDRNGKRALLRELRVSIKVSRDTKGLLITVNVMFAGIRITEPGN